MAANPYPAHVYYRCPHDPASPRHTAAHPDHPHTVQVPETLLDAITERFLNDRVFTPRRAPLLAAQFPATDADAQARQEADAAALRAQISKLDRQQNAQITALEEIDPDHPAAPPCVPASAPASNDMWALPQPPITGSLPQPSGWHAVSSRAQRASASARSATSPGASSTSRPASPARSKAVRRSAPPSVKCCQPA